MVSTVVERIDACIREDEAIPDFFSVMASADPPYYRSPQSTDIVAISSVIPLPLEVQNHDLLRNGEFRCGSLPHVCRWYLVFDNTVVLWEVTRSNIAEKITLNNGPITCVGAGIDYLAVGTANAINVFFVGTTDPNIVVPTDFIPTSFCPGPLGVLLVGGSDGSVSSVNFHLKIIIKYSHWSFHRPDQLPVVQICFDSSSGSIAALAEHSLSFYKFAEPASLPSTFCAPIGTHLISVSAIPLSDSDHIRFVAFSARGERFYFGTTTTFKLGSSISLRGTRKPPIELQSVTSAFYCMGYFCFSSGRSLVFLRQQSLGDAHELVGEVTIPGDGIAFGAQILPSDSSKHRDSLIWQHFSHPPQVFLLTSNCGVLLQFQTPCAALRRILRDNSREELLRFGANKNSECITTALILGAESVLMASQFAPSDAVNSFYARVARLLSPVWSSSAASDFRLGDLAEIPRIIREYEFLTEDSVSFAFEAEQLEDLANFVNLVIEFAQDLPSEAKFCEFIGNPVEFAEMEIARAMEELTDAHSDRTEEIAAILVKFCKFPLNLADICRGFFRMGEFRHPVRIAAKRAREIDPGRMGLYWWKNGCDEMDGAGRKAFCDVSACYGAVCEAVFDDTGREEMMQINDEIFHCTVFKSLLERGIDITSLSSRYLRPFLEANIEYP
jgi:hypothetical protein